MPWHEKLSPEQRKAAGHNGRPARLLAGPGTGKTFVMTRRVMCLVQDHKIAPKEILCLTFTRAATQELRNRIRKELGEKKLPRVSTLHSFALRELLRNAALIDQIPQPIRIADDWEERNIIQEDIRDILSAAKISDVQDKFQQLSSDWQTLQADQKDWAKRFPDPPFIGAWQEHRSTFGYLLRSELVYQLKRALEQHGNFTFEVPPKQLLVDEYQDLNRCDLAIISELGRKGAEVFAAGDDDQSIYGFRKAHPEGIRRFTRDFAGAADLSLNICKRCDPQVLDLALFVAEQDARRLKKALTTERKVSEGELGILRFPDQMAEAEGIASICTLLHNKHGLKYDDILILLRSDKNEAFSGVIRQALVAADLPVSEPMSTQGIFDRPPARQLLALLKVKVNPSDHLAWRTLFQVRKVGIGRVAIRKIYEQARKDGSDFCATVFKLAQDAKEPLPKLLKEVIDDIDLLLKLIPDPDKKKGREAASKALLKGIKAVAKEIIPAGEFRDALVGYLKALLKEQDECSLEELVRSLAGASDDIEQAVEKDKINILTMHKAKGLTARAVVVAACEDEYIPGRQLGEQIDDERRLLYVSLTRAQHYLFIAYCDRRVGSQVHSGRTAGHPQRTLTRFLRDGPLSPQGGPMYIAELQKDRTAGAKVPSKE